MAGSRYSNGWWPVLRMPWLVYGNGTIECLNVLTQERHDVSDPQGRRMWPVMLAAAGFVLKIETGDNGPISYVTYDPATRTIGPEGTTAPASAIPTTVTLQKIAGTDWEGASVGAVDRDGRTWAWTPCTAGSMEQSFLVGRCDALTGLVVVEMPSGFPQVAYDAVTDEWTLVGMDPGGLWQYRDGEMHVVDGVSSAHPTSLLSESIRTFDIVFVIPTGLQCAVWTFGDVIEGTIGGGESATKPNVQGIGLWPDGRPWLDLDKPLLGLWVSPKDSAWALRFYRDEAWFVRLITAYRVTAIQDDLVAMYRASKAAGSEDFWPIERRMAVEICKTRGCSLTLYHDGTTRDRSNDMIDRSPYRVPASEMAGTLYGFGDLDRLCALRDEGVAMIAGINVYPDGTAFWAYETAMDELDQLGLPYTLTVARYTQRNPVTGKMGYPPVSVALQLNMALLSASNRARCLAVDVFGVGRVGELPEFERWANRWTHDLINMLPKTVTGWPKTIVVPPVPLAVDCVLGEWSDWTPWTVASPSSSEGRERRRVVLTAASHGGAACGPLREVESRPKPGHGGKGVAIGATAGGLAGLFVWLIKRRKVKDHSFQAGIVDPKKCEFVIEHVKQKHGGTLTTWEVCGKKASKHSVE